MKIKHLVRQSLFFSLFLGGISLPWFAARAEFLPNIEAHQFKITPLEKSRTGRVYRFKVDPEQLPKTGSILLIQENEKPILAFRVLKTDTQKNEFIATRVRRYDTTSELQVNHSYQTVEKLADLVAPPPPEPIPSVKPVSTPSAVVVDATPAPIPLASPIPMPTLPPVTASDAVLDAPAAPSSRPAIAKNDEDLDGMADDALDDKDSEFDDDIEVKENVTLDPYKYGIHLLIGTYKNYSNLLFGNDGSGGTTLSFSHVIQQGVYFKKQIPQDTLSLEYGFSYYSRNNVNGLNDDYTFLPLKVELRYDIQLSAFWTPFLYFGAQYNLIMSTTNVDLTNSAEYDTYHNTGGFQPNVGVGLFYTIGPQWYLRGDAGLDRFAIGLTVKW